VACRCLRLDRRPPMVPNRTTASPVPTAAPDFCRSLVAVNPRGSVANNRRTVTDAYSQVAGSTNKSESARTWASLRLVKRAVVRSIMTGGSGICRTIAGQDVLRPEGCAREHAVIAHFEHNFSETVTGDGHYPQRTIGRDDRGETKSAARCAPVDRVGNSRFDEEGDGQAKMPRKDGT